MSILLKELISNLGDYFYGESSDTGLGKYR